jgi:hypothetical protein
VQYAFEIFGRRISQLLDCVLSLTADGWMAQAAACCCLSSTAAAAAAKKSLVFTAAAALKVVFCAGESRRPNFPVKDPYSVHAAAIWQTFNTTLSRRHPSGARQIP